MSRWGPMIITGALLLACGCSGGGGSPQAGNTPAKSGGGQAAGKTADDAAAVAALEKAGAKLEKDENGQVISVQFTRETTDADLQHLAGTPAVRKVALNEAEKISDDGLKVLGSLKQLQTLDLSWCEITGKGLSHLGSAAALENLDLSYTKIQDEHLEPLLGLKQLKVLNVEMTEITQAARNKMREANEQLTFSVNPAQVGGERPGDEPPAVDPNSPAGKFQAIVAEQEKAIQSLQAQLQKAQTRDEQMTIIGSYSGDAPFAERILALAEEHAADPSTVDMYVWILRAQGKPDLELLRRKAVEKLLEKHLNHESVREALEVLNPATSPAAMTLLRALSEKAEDKHTRVVATFQLAQALRNQVDISSQLKTIPAEREAFVAEQIGADFIAAMKAVDPKALAAEAEAALEKTIELAGDQEPSASIAAAAKNQLFAIRNLAIGATAPEIEGKDLDGNDIKLSDFRGRVVVLDFWGHW